jgi:hypothetical protein
MHFTRAAATILLAVAAFILPAVGTATAAPATSAAAVQTPDDTPWE